MSPASPCLRLPTPVLPQEEPRPAFFLDRDDTLIPDVPYLRDPAGVRLFPRSAAALRYSLAAHPAPAIRQSAAAPIARSIPVSIPPQREERT